MDKTEMFVKGFYISIISIMFLASFFDFILKNYVDFYFEIFFIICTVCGLIYFNYSKDISVSKHIIIFVSTIGSYIFLVTSSYTISVFVSIVSLSFFLLFPIKRAIYYSLIHQLIVAFIYIYGYIYYYIDIESMVSTFIASLLMIFLGIVYHISIENSYNELEQSNRNKEILIKEIHHRVKNNLQIILSIIQLQSLKIEEKGFLNDLENRIDAIANIYDLLIINDDLEYINMQNYIDTLLHNIQKGFLSNQKNIDIEMSIDVSLPLKEATYIGIIINELLTNSYKYAFKDMQNGYIYISFIEKNQSYILTIKDNGRGFNFNGNRKSLGLNLVIGLVREQLKGTIICNSIEHTEYNIEFKIE